MIRSETRQLTLTLNFLPNIPKRRASFPRLVGKGGLDLYGKSAPAGTEVACNAWLIRRDPAVYGPDADAFDSERWLVDPDRAREYASKYSLGFGYGARVCLGKDLAHMELFKAPLQFLRAFRPRTRNPEEPARYVFRGGIAYFDNMWITIERRAPVVRIRNLCVCVCMYIYTIGYERSRGWPFRYIIHSKYSGRPYLPM